ncbi:rCG40637 [Rattus norvegicus]|uniref:RCG40637 n=1 Tax=Rattus norvegicus TaxID=10116 RepID=A6I662_RAT|nr:rCG40637 [Rattus norvegicus]
MISLNIPGLGKFELRTGLGIPRSYLRKHPGCWD